MACLANVSRNGTTIFYEAKRIIVDKYFSSYYPLRSMTEPRSSVIFVIEN